MTGTYEGDIANSVAHIEGYLDRLCKLKIIQLKLYARNHGQYQALSDYLGDAEIE